MVLAVILVNQDFLTWKLTILKAVHLVSVMKLLTAARAPCSVELR